MTLRSVLLGLLGAALICGVAYYNDFVIRQTYVVGNFMPIAVYGGLVLFVVLVNPVLRRLRQAVALSAPELAVILVLITAGCSIPTSGLMRCFTSSLMLPYHVNRTSPDWQERRVLDHVPPAMAPTVTKENEARVLDDYVRGQGEAQAFHVRDLLARVPWSAWSGTLRFWLPLIGVLWIGLIGLALVVHRQWANHEQLPYPIAGFATALLPGAQRAVSGVLRSRLFWIAAAIIFLIQMNNYGCAWFPASFGKINLTLNFSSLQQLFPTLVAGNGQWWIFKPALYFTVIAFAYFLAADVSFSMAVGPVLWVYVVGMLTTFGVTLGKPDVHEPNMANFLIFGAYAGMLLVLLYTGRRFYWDTLLGALWSKAARVRSYPESIWGARVFLVAMLVFIGLLVVFARLDIVVAVLFTGVLTMTFVVMSRIVAETGVFFVQSNLLATAVVAGIFGAGALGMPALIVVTVLTVIFMIDPRETLMPFIVNGFKLLDNNAVPIGRTAGATVATLAIGLAIAVPVTLYLQYSLGAQRVVDAWPTSVAKAGFDSAVTTQSKLASQGLVDFGRPVGALEHFTKMRPDGKLALTFGIGLALVLLFTTARLRFTKWPLHPVMFLVWSTYPGFMFAASFFIGWLAKVLVMKYGGSRVYHNLKPLMFGLIAGEMIAGLVIMIIGAIYFLLTGQPPKVFNVTVT